jgi:uncharacterized membrane protein YdjX (TVP38/TMEM64 family)
MAAANTLGTDTRRMQPLEAPEISENILDVASIGDPEKPISLEGLVLQIAPDTTGQRIATGPIIVAGAILVAVLLALVWRFTALADVITPLSMIAWAQSLADYWWAPIALIIAYTPASLVMFPRWLITLAAVATFGPWMAFAYAQTGVLIAALCGYVAGELVDRHRKAWRPANQPPEQAIATARIFAVTLVRLVPIAPFMVING